MTRCTGVAQLKGNVFRKIRTRDNVEQETQKGWTLGKIKWMRQEGGKGIKDLGSRQPLYLEEERVTTNSNREELRTVIISGKWRNTQEDFI
jgi:hypothetical protein